MADGREVLELDAEQELDVLDEQEEEKPETDDLAEEEEGGEETVICFEGEEGAAPASESDNSVIRELRKANRELAKRVAEQERKAPERIEVGDKPTLESCEYDEERFETSLTAWHQRKAKAEEQDRQQQDRKKADEDAWQKRIQVFEAGKARLGVSDFEDAEAEVQAALPPETMAILLHSEKSAEMVYALSRAPAKLKELSELNPLRAAMMIGKLEDKVQMTKRKLPDPDRPLRGNAAPGASADKELARLEKEAEATGNRTKVIQYKRKLKERA